MDKLMVSGQSFGGMTAIKVAHEDARVKLCASLDPWSYCNHEEIGRGEVILTVPLIIVSTETFHPFLSKDFPSWETVKNLFKHAKNPKNENIIIKNTSHFHQCDLASIIPLELSIKSKILP